MEMKASAASNRELSDEQAGVPRNSGKASEGSIRNLSGKKGRYEGSLRPWGQHFHGGLLILHYEDG